MQIDQKLSVRGDITIRVIEAATGEVLRRMEIRNLITANGLAVVGALLQGYPTLADTRHIGEIRVGTGVTAPTTGDTGIQADPGGTPVSVPVVVTVASAGSSTEVKCVGQLTTAQANGFSISEAGLFTVNSTGGAPLLFARQVFSGIPKTSSLAIAFDWRITFTA